MKTTVSRFFRSVGLLGAFVTLILLAASFPARAQVIKGSISGTVTDPTGAVVPGAAVSAKEQATGQAFSTQSDSAGLFRLSLLPVGTYNVEVTKSGFKKYVVTGVGVSASVDHGLGSISLEVGETSTTVEVTAAPPLLHSTQAQVTNTLTTQSIQTLPGTQENQGMDVLALLTPGVVNDRDTEFSNTNGTGFANNGLRGRSNDFQIDGQNNNDNSVTGPYVFLGDPYFVSEYQITTDNFGPEFGRNSGSVVNIITKSGTNVWHGNVFGTESNSSLDTLTNTQKAFEGLHKVPHFNDEFSGGTIGGPLRPNKVFLFAGFDNELITGQKAVYSSGNLTPTPAGLSEMAACYPGSASVLALERYGPYGVTAGNPTPEGGVITKTLTGASAPGGTCAVDFAGVQRTLSTGDHQFDSVIRMDFQGQNDTVSARWLYQWLDFFNADSFGTAASGYPVNVPSLGVDWGLSWTHSFSPSIVNEFRYSYGRLTAEFGGNSFGNTVPKDTNLETALANIALPSGYLGFGPATSAPQGRIVNTYQTQDNLSMVHGRHQFKMGFNWTYQRSPNLFLPNANGQFRFSSMSHFAQNIPSSINITQGTPTLDFRENDWFFYFGDDYKLRPNLTLNLGLTYSFFGQPANLFHNIDVKRESNASTAFFNPGLPLSVRTAPDLPSDKSDWGPSIGFAYSPHFGGFLTGGNTVLRGGYRLAYDPPFYNIYLNIASSAPQVLAQTITGGTAAGLPLPSSPYGPAVRSELAAFLVKGTQDPRNFAQTTVTPNFSPQRTHEWSFGVQREISKAAVFEARYVGNHATKLFQSINANPYVADLAAAFPSFVPSGVTPCPAASAVVASAVGRANCNEGVVRERTNTGLSDYNGLQFELRGNQIAHQLTLKTGYTWSKGTDNASDIFSTFGGGDTVGFSQNPFDFVHGEHSLSAFDIPQEWTLAFVEQIPFWRNGRGVAGHILGGWTLSGTYFLASGQPYTPVQFYTNTFTGGVGNDFAFDTHFIGTYETSRPFLATPSAPASNVGIFAGDACSFFGAGCGLAPNAVLNFNTLNNGTDTVGTVVPKSSVHYIVNGGEAQAVFNTPWGNAGRNTLRDYHTNTANFSLQKEVRVNERLHVQWHMSMINVFNHPNFSSVDPFIEDAGLTSEGTGFAIPSLTNGGSRAVRFGVNILF